MQAPDTPHDDRRERLGAILVAGIVGLALVAVMITRTSEAVFTASVDNSGNSFQGGTVTLVDNNDADAVMFAIEAMDPDETYTSCIDVVYEGTVASPSAVKVYSGADPTGDGVTGELADHIEITVERGTSTSDFGDCSTFTADVTTLPATPLRTFYTARTNHDNGVGTWVPASTPETQTYRITADLLDSVPPEAAGQTVEGVTFVWEIQS